MTPASMLGYTKQVLSKVSFDLGLFEKELRKSIRMVAHTELPQLLAWCRASFTSRPFRLIIERCFRCVAPAV